MAIKNFLCTAALLALTLSAHAQSFVVVDLGTLGGKFSISTAISSPTTINPERIIGFFTIFRERSTHAFLVKNSVLQDLHPHGSLKRGGNTSAAFGMSPARSIVGTAMVTRNHQSHPFFIQSGTSALQDIGTLGRANAVPGRRPRNPGRKDYSDHR